VRVALDATYSLGPQPSGVAAYSAHLIGALAGAFPDERFLLCYRANRFLSALSEAPPGPNCSRHLLEGFTAWLLDRRADLFHGLNQKLPRRRFRRAVTTFHDLFVFTGEYSTPEFRKRFMGLAREAAERSDHLIAVSRFTAEQASLLLGFPKERISVVPHGVTPVPEIPEEEIDRFRHEEDLEDPFLLHVGAIQTRKNVSRLVKAFEGLRTHCLLVLAGSAGYGAERIFETIEGSPARDRIRVYGYVDPGFLAFLYRSALMLVFPSLGEGFGLPVLEAMSAGLPVITSRTSALPEVAGEAALFVDPEETGEIRSAIERLLDDAELYGRLRDAGRERAAQFSWLKTAHQTLQVYRRLL